MTSGLDIVLLLKIGIPILSSAIAIFASVFVSSKIAEFKIKRLEIEIKELRELQEKQRDRLISAEKEISNTLKAIEVKLGELNKTIELFMKYSDEQK